MCTSEVVVTGLGVETSIGLNVNDFWTSLLKGKSGISEIEDIDILEKNKYGGQIKNIKSSSYISRIEELFEGSVNEAIEDSDLVPEDIDDIIVGTTIGYDSYDYLKSIYEHNVDSNYSMNTLDFITHTMNSLNIINARPLLLCNACSSGSNALITAFEKIKHQKSKVALISGVDAFSQLAYYGFSRLGNMAKEQCKPFDVNRDGMLLGEGCGSLILESKDHALERGAEIICQISGYGISSDAYHINIPEPEGNGIRKATLDALNYGHIEPSKVDYISAHGTGTKSNDKVEAEIFSDIFNNQNLPISSIKSMIGHTMGASSALESIVCCLSIRDGKIPPTTNLNHQDEDCSIYCVSNHFIERDVNYALNNAYGFGGSNASVLFKKYI